MRVFVAGASGVIGRSAVHQLVRSGHEVIGTTRSPAKTSLIKELGAEPVVLRLLDADGVKRELERTRPEVVVNMVTDLSTPPNFRTLDKSFTSTNQLRTIGTDLLLAASLRAGVARYVGQSFAGWFAQPGPAPLCTDDDAGFLASPPPAARKTTFALRHLERAVTTATGLSGAVLRFGPLYGPGTSMGAGGAILNDVRRGRVPIVGGGDGVWSFTHVEDAGSAVLLAAEREDLRGVFNAVDDEPAPVSMWLPHLAATLGAPAPKRLPRWLARPVVGDFGLHVMTTARGADNGAFREFGYELTHPSWQEGFRDALGVA
jgi:nucleoside-diphosphate-sugar epimerase